MKTPKKHTFRPSMSRKQKKLAAAHGHPAEFARSLYEAVPGEISMAEARTAVDEYQREWDAAAA